MRIVICESGATKADWRVVEDGRQVCSVSTSGTNVSAMAPAAVEAVIRDASLALPSGPYAKVFFYTAGVLVPQMRASLAQLITSVFGALYVEISSDLIASARAACGHEPGVAAILGTGSNSCQWDGQKIVRQVRSGGFILGDEGSASAIGRQFISDYIKGLVPEEVSLHYREQFPSSYEEIVELVYHNQGSPSAWLGSLCPFLMTHYSNPYVRDLVDGSIRSFATRCIKQYDDVPVGIVGGFGYAMRDVVSRIFAENGIHIRAFVPSPIEELVKFHVLESF